MPRLTKKELRARAAEKRKLKKLRDLGLTGKRKIDLRKNPGKRERNLLQKFSDVLTGKAKVIDLGKPSRTRRYRDFKKTGSKVIVPRRKGERITVSKDGEIVSTRKIRGETVRSIIAPKSPGKMKAPKGKRLKIQIPFQSPAGIVYQTFDDWAEAEAFMQGYERYKNWKDYVIVAFVDAGE